MWYITILALYNIFIAILIFGNIKINDIKETFFQSFVKKYKIQEPLKLSNKDVSLEEVLNCKEISEKKYHSVDFIKTDLIEQGTSKDDRE